MRILRGRLLAALLSTVSTAALAQTPAPPEKAVEAVVVTGAAAQVQTSIDRRSYSLGKDIQATSGSIADALRNLPSVEVDLQGALSLRGDPNVTILVDGKPSGAFEGSGRADALQQFPADQIERVEIIANPSAAMNPEGSGGVINLITRKSRGSGWTGSAYATAGSAGLKRAGGTFGYNSARLNVTGALSGVYQRNKSHFDEIRSTLNAAGQFADHGTIQIGRNLTRGPTGKITVGYALTPRDQLTATANRNEILVYGYPFNHFDDRAVGGAITAFQDRQGKRHNQQTDTGLTANWRHSFAGDGHQLSVDLVRNTNAYDDEILWANLASLPARPLLELNNQDFAQRHSEFRAAYTRPMGGTAKLVVGYELKIDDNLYSGDVARGPARAALVAVPSTAYVFDYGQTLNAGYATYEAALGDLNLQGGLRVENARLSLDEASSPSFRPDYLRAYPSLHLTYTLDEARKLSASYSRRVQRPPAFLLNPFRVYADPKTATQGNPDLKPQDTDSFEAGFEQRRAGTTLLATVYYRSNKGEFSPVLHDEGNGVFLATYDNLGSSKTAGLELVANGKLARSLSYSANANLSYKTIRAYSRDAAGERSAYSLGGRVNLDWQARPADLLQVNLAAQGKRLFAQGVLQPSYTVNLGWRHRLTDAVTATVSAQDVLKGSRGDRLFVTPTLRDDARFRPVSRAISLRLDYRFGGKGKTPARDPAFEYDAPAGS